MSNVELSIVSTMYCSSRFVGEFHRLVSKAASEITSSYEIILVNDGSPDNSLEIAMDLFQSDKHVRIVDLSRNFGHHRAIMVGLEYAKGDRVFLIDSDLEEDPLTLSSFVKEMDNTKADVIYGFQATRQGKTVRKWGGAGFWYLYNLISEIKVTPNVLTSRLMTRRYVNAVLEFKEKEIFLAGVFGLAGFKQLPLLVEKGARDDSSYTIRKRFNLLINAITSFSSRPLVYVFYLGLIISIIGAISMTTLIVRKIFFGGYLTGWASLIVSIWLLGGLTIFSLGIIGIYLSKVFQEVKNRPLSIVRNVIEHADN